MAAMISHLVIIFAYVALLLQGMQAKPHGFKGHRRFRHELQGKRAPNPNTVATTTVTISFTTTECTTDPTASSAPDRQCKHTKVAILGAGVAGITAAVRSIYLLGNCKAE
jgi:hypothetical protein